MQRMGLRNLERLTLRFLHLGQISDLPRLHGLQELQLDLFVSTETLMLNIKECPNLSCIIIRLAY
jgi:hypothetical protein